MLGSKLARLSLKAREWLEGEIELGLQLCLRSSKAGARFRPLYWFLD